MNKYLSYGAGVDSTALLLWLIDQGEEFETIFVNHGGDYPETYEYITYLREEGFEITEIIPDVQGCHTILEYCYKYKIFPVKMRRWCTAQFKIKPIYDYVEKPCIMFIGITSDESQRARKSRVTYFLDRDIHNIYPFIAHGITRRKCIEIIKEHGLIVPPKSGCFFCPFMNKQNARDLFLYYPPLFKKVLELERNCSRPGYYLIPHIPFDKFARANIPPLTKFLLTRCYATCEGDCRGD